MSEEIKKYLEKIIKSGEIVFVDGERRKCSQMYFDYNNRLIEIYQKGEKGAIEIVPLEAVKEIVFEKEKTKK